MIAKNVAYLYLIQAVRLLLPVALLSVLTKSLTTEQYGIYVYTIAASAWLSIFVEYGFNISATRRIAASPDGIHVTTAVVQTQAAKLLLIGLSASFLVWALFYSVVFEKYVAWAFSAWLLGGMIGYTPTYYFQGKSSLKIVALLEAGAGIASLVLVLFCIKTESDFWKLAVILLITRFCVWQVLDRIMFMQLGVARRSAFSAVEGVKALKDGWKIFVVQAAASMYTSFNVVLLGAASTPASVSVYGSAERVSRAGLSFIGQATAAVFPHLNNLKAENNVRLQRVRLNILAIFFIGALFCIPVVYFLAPVFSVYIFGNKFPEMVGILRLMSLVIPAIAISNVLAIHFLVVDNMEHLLNKIVISAVPISLVGGYILARHYGALGMTVSWLCVEWYVSAVLLIVLFLNSRRSK